MIEIESRGLPLVTASCVQNSLLILSMHMPCVLSIAWCVSPIVWLFSFGAYYTVGESALVVGRMVRQNQNLYHSVKDQVDSDSDQFAVKYNNRPTNPKKNDNLGVQYAMYACRFAGAWSRVQPMHKLTWGWKKFASQTKCPRFFFLSCLKSESTVQPWEILWKAASPLLFAWVLIYFETQP